MKPSKKNIFLPIEKLAEYIDETKYFCNHVSFLPKADEIDFWDDVGKYPPPFIEIIEIKTEEVFYFEIPKIVAYYAVTHPGYTYKGLKDRELAGERNFKIKLHNLLKL